MEKRHVPVDSYYQQSVERWITSALESGIRDVWALMQLAEQDGLSWRTVERAKKRLGIRSVRKGGYGEYGRWVWVAPDDDDAGGAS